MQARETRVKKLMEIQKEMDFNLDLLQDKKTEHQEQQEAYESVRRIGFEKIENLKVLLGNERS